MLKVHSLIIRNQNLYYRKKLNLNNINTINQYNNEVKYHWLYLNNINYLFHYKCNYKYCDKDARFIEVINVLITNNPKIWFNWKYTKIVM